MSSAITGRATRLAEALARRTRALPLTEKIGGRVAGRLRDSQTAREVVSRIFDIDVTRVGQSVFLEAGRLVGGHGLDRLPVVLVSLVGAVDENVPAILERVAQEQVLTAGFRPVILLDSDQFAEVRQYGWPVDFVVPEKAWTAGDVSWHDYVRGRLRSMRRAYGAVALVELADPEGPGADVLASMGG